MTQGTDIHNLQQLLDQLGEADHGPEQISVDMVLHTVGRRAFGPVLLVPGLFFMSPLSGIPGAPTTLGVLVLLIAGQLLLGRSEFWLPAFLLRRSISRKRYEKALHVMRPIARFIDRLLKPRLRFLTRGWAVYLIAAICLLISLVAPLLEVVPFAITSVGAAVTAFGLALIANDGLLALLALGFCIATGVVAGTALL